MHIQAISGFCPVLWYSSVRARVGPLPCMEQLAEHIQVLGQSAGQQDNIAVIFSRMRRQHSPCNRLEEPGQPPSAAFTASRAADETMKIHLQALAPPALAGGPPHLGAHTSPLPAAACCACLAPQPLQPRPPPVLPPAIILWQFQDTVKLRQL